MKKLIVLFVVFILLAGTAFAEFSIGGAAGFGMNIISGDSSKKGDDDPVMFTGLGSHWVGLDFTWRADDGSAGGKIKFNGNTSKGHETFWPARVGGGLWWRPLELLKVTFWHIEDETDLGVGNAVDWGYQTNGASAEVTALWEDNGWNSYSNGVLRTGHGFFGGVGGGGDPHLALQLYPIPGLEVGLAWEFTAWGEKWGDDEAALMEDTVEFFKKTFAQVKYDINGIGSAALSFNFSDSGGQGGPGPAIGIYPSFTFWAVDGMNIELSAKILIPVEDSDGNKFDGTMPLEIGLGYALNQWSDSAFQLFARLGAYLPGDYTNMAFSDKATVIGLDVNPNYDIGMFRVYFDMGIGVVLPENNDTGVVWHFNPYLKKSIGGIGDVYFGFNIWNNKVAPYWYEGPLKAPITDDIINWAVPVFFTAWF